MMEGKRMIARYKPDISLGNILTIVGMLMAVVVWGLRLEGRLDKEEKMSALRQEKNDLRFVYIESRISQNRSDYTEGLATIKTALTRIEDKLDGKADKAK